MAENNQEIGNLGDFEPYWTYYNSVEYINISFETVQNNDSLSIGIVSRGVELGMTRPDKSVRALISVKNARTRPETMRKMMAVAKEVQPKMKKSAIVGSIGLLSLLMKIYIAYTGSTMRFFTSKESALNYITSD